MARRARRRDALSPARLAELLEAHRRTTGEAVLAESTRGRTTRVPFDEASDAVVKETRRRPGLLGALAGLVRPSRARRADEAAHVLEGAGVPVAETLGVVEDGATSWLVVRHVPGVRLDRALASALALGDARDAFELVLAAARLAGRIHAAGVAHGDLKPANILVAGRDAEGRPRLVVLDLDAARVGPVSLRARARDLAASDAYGQRGARRVDRRVRLEAFEEYLGAAGLPAHEEYVRAVGVTAREARTLLRLVVARSLWKRARWRSAGA